MTKKSDTDNKKWFFVLYGNTEKELIKAENINEASILAHESAKEQKTIVIRIKES